MRKNIPVVPSCCKNRIHHWSQFSKIPVSKKSPNVPQNSKQIKQQTANCHLHHAHFWALKVAVPRLLTWGAWVSWCIGPCNPWASDQQQSCLPVERYESQCLLIIPNRLKHKKSSKICFKPPKDSSSPTFAVSGSSSSDNSQRSHLSTSCEPHFFRLHPDASRARTVGRKVPTVVQGRTSRRLAYKLVVVKAL